MLSVWEKYGVLSGIPRVDDELMQAATEEMANDGRERATTAGLVATSAAVEAEDGVAAAIIRAAEGNDAVLIVMGTRGNTGIRSLLLGSISNEVAHHAHCPLLLVPSGTLAEARGAARFRRGPLCGSPGLDAAARFAPLHAHAAVDGDTAGGGREHGIEVELGDLRHVQRERREAMHEIGDRHGVERRLAAESRHEAPTAPACTRPSASTSVSGAIAIDTAPTSSASTPPRPSATSGPKSGSWTTPAISSAPSSMG